MPQKKKRFLHIIPALVCFFAMAAAGMWYASGHDLQISQALHPLWQKAATAFEQGTVNGWFALGILTEVFGEWPPALALGLLGVMCWARGSRAVRKMSAWQRLLPTTKKQAACWMAVGFALTVAGALLLALRSLNILQERRVLATESAVRFAVALVLLTVVLLWGTFGKLSCAGWVRWTAFGGFAVAMTVSHFVVIQLMKLLWQRTRFDTMLAAGNFDAYSIWYRVGDGGSSFPSGHTAAAGVLLITVVACSIFDSCREQEKNFVFFAMLVTVTVAFGRIVIGRHFLSDTIAALCVDVVLAALWYYLPTSQKWMAKAASRADALQMAESADAMPQTKEDAEQATVKGAAEIAGDAAEKSEAEKVEAEGIAENSAVKEESFECSTEESAAEEGISKEAAEKETTKASAETKIATAKESVAPRENPLSKTTTTRKAKRTEGKKPKELEKETVESTEIEEAKSWPENGEGDSGVLKEPIAEKPTAEKATKKVTAKEAAAEEAAEQTTAKEEPTEKAGKKAAAKSKTKKSATEEASTKKALVKKPTAEKATKKAATKEAVGQTTVVEEPIAVPVPAEALGAQETAMEAPDIQASTTAETTDEKPATGHRKDRIRRK